MTSSNNFSPNFKSQNLLLDDSPFFFHKKLFPLPPIFSTAPLTWISFFRKDLYLSALCSTNKPPSQLKLSSLSLSDKDNNFLQKWRAENELDLFPVNQNEISIFKHTHNQIDELPEPEFMRLLREALSDSRLVWLLIERFFSSEHYVILPFVNKRDFIKSIQELIGPRHNNLINLNLTGTHDLALIGTLLMIMRLTSNGLYNFDKEIYPYSDSMEDIDYMVKNKTSEDILKLLPKIQVQLEKVTYDSTSLEMFQFFLLYQYFGIFDPENCDCVKTASAFNTSFLLNYAIQCSLNIDPDEYIDDALFKSQPDKNLLRRLWFGLVGLDSYQYLTVGNPKIIQDSMYNTKLPTLKEGMSEIELLLNRCIIDHIEFYQNHMNSILDAIIPLRPNYTFTQIQLKLDNLKKYISTLKTAEQIASLPCDTISGRYDNIKNICFLSASLSVYYLVSYHFFIQYIIENRNPSKAFDYFMDCMDTFHTALNNAILFSDPKNIRFNYQKYFGSGTLVFPKLEATLHKTNLILFTLLGRLRAAILLKESRSKAELSIFNEIFIILDKLVRHILDTYVCIGKEYYHSWIISKVQGVMLGQIVNSAKNGTDSIVESRYIQIISKYSNYDPGFRAFDIQTFEIIVEKLKSMLKIQDYSKNNIVQNDATIPVQKNKEMIFQNDKKWLERMISEFNLPYDPSNFEELNETPKKKAKVSGSSSEQSSQKGGAQSLSKTIDDDCETISMVSTPGDNLALMGDIDDILNANVDLGGIDEFDVVRTVNNHILQYPREDDFSVL